MSAEGPPPVDQAEREKAATWTAGPVLVEAGAGTGKTRLIVDRALHLVGSGEARLGEIAAITFTIKAAAELRERIRVALVKKLGAGEKNPEVLSRLREALEEIDRAPISTIHSFALKLLRERPLDAGLRPDAEVNPLAFEELRDRVWEEWLTERLSGEDPALAVFLELGFSIAQLSTLRDAMLELPEMRGGFPAAEGLTPGRMKESIRKAFSKWKKRAAALCRDKSDKAF
ncbi:MAG: UvrD-helicase domain-containing protein, partial [bacterium]